MSKDELRELKAENLNQWFSDKTIPSKEKSYISQLINGKASLGEKSARRLEHDYSMLEFYLDKINNNEVYETKPNNQHHANSHYMIKALDISSNTRNGFLNSDVKKAIKLIECDSSEAKILFNGDRIYVFTFGKTFTNN